MFFSKSIVAVVLAVASSLVVAVPANGGCGNTGSISCCNSFQHSDNQAVINLFDLMGQGTQLLGSTGQVGFACSSPTGGAVNCQQQAACCTGSSFNGAFALGCSSIISPAPAP